LHQPTRGTAAAIVDGTGVAFIGRFIQVQVFVQSRFILVPAFIQGPFIPTLALTRGRFTLVLAFIRDHFNNAQRKVEQFDTVMAKGPKVFASAAPTGGATLKMGMAGEWW
jgi:hypothetical protein